MVHDLFDLFVGHERAVNPGDARAIAHIEHVALTQQLFSPLFTQNGAAVDLRGHLEGNPGGEVRLDRAGDDIDRGALRRHDQVDARGPRHLRQSLDASLDLFARDHHQVGHLIDDHDDIGEGFGLEFLGLEDRFSGILVKAGLDGALEHLALGQRLADAAVIALDVAHAHLGHLAVTVLHLAHDPFQRDDGLFRVGDDGRQQMRDAVIDRQFQHLRVDHDQPALIRRQLVQQRQDHGVDRHRLTGPRGPRDQQVGHLGKVGHHRIAADILAKRQRQRMGAVAKGAAGQDFAQDHLFAPRIGQLDPDHGAARHGGNPRRQRRHRPRDIIRQPDHPAGLQTGCRLQFIQRDHGAGADLGDLAFDAVIVQHRLQHAGVFGQCLLRHQRLGAGAGRRQQRQRRTFIICARFVETHLRLGLGAGLTRGRGGRLAQWRHDGTLGIGAKGFGRGRQDRVVFPGRFGRQRGAVLVARQPCGDGGQNRRLAGAAADRVRDPAADLGGRRGVAIVIGVTLDQFRLGQVILQQVGLIGAVAAGEQPADAGGGAGFGRGGCGPLAALAHPLRQVGRQLRAAPQQPHHHVIGRDQPDQEPPPQRAQLGPLEPQHEGQKHDQPDRDQQRRKADPQRGLHRQQVQDQPHHHIAEMPAQTIGRLPFRPRRQRAAIDRPQRHRHRQEHRPHDPFFAPVQHQPQAPDGGTDHQHPRAIARDHHQRRGDRGPDPAQQVLRRFIRRRQEETGIVGRPAGQQHGDQHGQHHQTRAGQFLAAPFQRRLRVLIEKRIALFRLPACHAVTLSRTLLRRHIARRAAGSARPRSHRAHRPAPRG